MRAVMTSRTYRKSSRLARTTLVSTLYNLSHGRSFNLTNSASSSARALSRVGEECESTIISDDEIATSVTLTEHQHCLLVRSWSAGVSDGVSVCVPGFFEVLPVADTLERTSPMVAS